MEQSAGETMIVLILRDGTRVKVNGPEEALEYVRMNDNPVVEWYCYKALAPGAR